MEDVAGLAIEPSDRVAFSKSWNQSKARRNISMEGQHAQLVVFQNIEVMEKRQVMQDGVVLGEANIVR